jgi:twitching motility protein PilT
MSRAWPAEAHELDTVSARNGYEEFVVPAGPDGLTRQDQNGSTHQSNGAGRQAQGPVTEGLPETSTGVTPSMADLLTAMMKQGASDLHLMTGTHPQVRVKGELEPLTEFERLTAYEVEGLTNSLLNDAQRQRFEAEHELDLSFEVPGLARFRANIYRQCGTVAAAVRVIPLTIPTVQDLGLPPVVEHLAERPKGLVLVTGPTGSGKSTTLAAVIDKINRERAAHIVTIEDPIEFVHPHRKSLVTQRQVLADTHSFNHALKSLLRQDPDVVLVGEMRDLDTIQSAITIAETGHLTFGTLHTNSAAQTINRMIDVFPEGRQAQIRAQLSLVLEGVLSQMLLRRADGSGRAMALEVLVMTPAIRNMIRENQVPQIYSAMQSGAKFGIQTMNQSLTRLVCQHIVSREDALAHSPYPDELGALLGPRM